MYRITFDHIIKDCFQGLAGFYPAFFVMPIFSPVAGFFYSSGNILIFFVLLIATLLLGIWQIKNPKLKTADDLSDDLCLYCPLDDDEKGTHGVPNGYISCEGRCCQEAYEMYIEEWTE